MARERRILPQLKLVAYLSITCLMVLLVQSKYASAQVDSGAITGTVTDSSGAVVPDADVTLINTDQGLTLQTKTSSSGGYTFSPVRIGNYSIDVSAKGFAKTTQRAIKVNVAQVLQVNIALKPGAATETVEVNTAPPLLQTEEASVGQVIGGGAGQQPPAQRPQLHLPRPARRRHADSAGRHPRQRRLGRLLRQRPAALRRTTTFLTASTTTPTPSTSSTAPTSSSFLRLTQFRNSRCRPRTSALSSAAQPARC